MSPTVGKYLMIAGGLLLAVGLVVYLAGDKLRWLGRLPGDIRVENPNGGGFYFPIVTCIVLSVVLNLLIWLIRRFLS